ALGDGRARQPGAVDAGAAATQNFVVAVAGPVGLGGNAGLAVGEAELELVTRRARVEEVRARRRHHVGRTRRLEDVVAGVPEATRVVVGVVARRAAHRGQLEAAAEVGIRRRQEQLGGNDLVHLDLVEGRRMAVDARLVPRRLRGTRQTRVAAELEL